MEKGIITSRQNPLVKWVCALAEKKRRSECKSFRFDGIKLLCEAIDAGVNIKYVICRENASERIFEIAENARKVCGAEMVTVSAEVFSKMTDEKTPEGVITVAGYIDGLHQNENTAATSIDISERILIAEALRDPGNLGTIIRSCYALGIDRLILTSDCADLYNPKTVRAAMGAIFRLPTVTVESSELSSFINELSHDGRRVYAAALQSNAKSINDLDLRRGDCFVIGNEGHGLCENTVEACTASVIIPMREGAESLNASAAAAICIWETVRAE